MPLFMNQKFLIFVLIVVAEIASAYAGIWQGVYVFKPLIMLSLLYWCKHYWHTHKWLWIGMWFALAGDIFLMIRERDMFVAGLGAFLLMQVCYIIAFWQSNRASLKSNWWLLALPFIVYGIVFLMVLHPSFAQNVANQPLWIPVVAYACCLCSMGVAANFRYNAVPNNSYKWVLIGAILFILSDSGIAINKFLYPFETSTLFIMSTYAAAQWLIVWGVAKKQESSANNDRRFL